MHPRPIALFLIKTMFVGLFSPKKPHFSIVHAKFPQFSPFFLKEPILDKCR